MEDKDTRLTSMPNGECVLKNSPEVEFFGKIDETIAVLSLAKTHLEHEQAVKERDFITDIQNNLMLLPGVFQKGTEISANFYAQLNRIEARIALLEQHFTYPNKFIVPETREESFVHFARTCVRELERRFCRVSDNKAVSQYLNKLSSYFFALCVLLFCGRQ